MAINSAFAKMYRRRISNLFQRSQNLFRCRHPATPKSDLALRSDQIHRTLHEQSIGVIKLRYFLSFVHQQRKILPAQRHERYSVPGVVRQREIGRDSTNHQWIGKEPAKHYGIPILMSTPALTVTRPSESEIMVVSPACTGTPG